MANFKDHNDEYTDEDRYGVQGVIDEINEVPAMEESFEEEEDFGDLSEVEIRLEEANCLKALLNNSLFEEPLSPIAKRVERRIRAFIHTELKGLLGINIPKPEAKIFTPDELTVLKALANKVISKNKDILPQAAPEVIPAKMEPAPVVKKSPSPEIKVRRTRTRTENTIQPKPTRETRSPEQITADLSPTTEVTLPNGIVVSGVSAVNQIRGNGAYGYPPLSPAQQADFYEQQALTSRPSDGILGILTNAVDRNNASNPEE